MIFSYFNYLLYINNSFTLNLKTGVIKNTRTELILNRSYHEMAEHYGTAIIPARPLDQRINRMRRVL